jgi:DNA-binding response OmpR family regulator
MNIILLDNESDRVKLIVSALARAGHSCLQIAHVDELPPRLSQERCDMLMIDWQATLGRGIGLLKSLRIELPPKLPILLLTAREVEDDIATALEAGADDYLLKPLRRAELVFRTSISLKRA